MKTIEKNLNDVEMENRQPHILLNDSKKLLLGEQVAKGVSILIDNPDYVVMPSNIYFNILGKPDIRNVVFLLNAEDEEQKPAEVLKISDDIELTLADKLADGIYTFVACFEYVIMSKITYFDVIMKARK